MQSAQRDHALLVDMRENRDFALYWMAAMASTYVDHEEIKFGFPNEYTLPSGAYYAKWPNQIEIAISPKHDFFVWRRDGYYPNAQSKEKNVTRINCDGLLQCLACIHHVLQENNILFEVTS